MLLKVIQATYINEYKIDLIFNDGVEGMVDLRNSIGGEVFEPLKNIEYFKTFTRNNWTIEWDCDADFAPEYLHALVFKSLENDI